MSVGALALLVLARTMQAQEVGPRQGDRIRVELRPSTAGPLGLGSPLEGLFIMYQDSALIASGPSAGAVRLPLRDIESLQIARSRSTTYSVARGALAGTAFGVGMWQFLKVLCRSGCDSGLGSAWLPATITGGLVALIVGTRAPGHHWVRVPLPR